MAKKCTPKPYLNGVSTILPPEREVDLPLPVSIPPSPRANIRRSLGFAVALMTLITDRAACHIQKPGHSGQFNADKNTTFRASQRTTCISWGSSCREELAGDDL